MAKFGRDLAVALLKPTGKKGPNSETLFVWHDYIAGTDPTDVNSVFRANVEVKDGKVRIAWTPNLNEDGVTRIYKTYGRIALGKGVWETPVQPWHKFFKVTVTLPTGEPGEKTATFDEGFVPEEDPGGVQLWENGPYWAECNVGATKPEECGYYFWWGDTVGYVYDGTKWVASDGSSSDFCFNNRNNENPTIATMWKDNATLESEGWIGEDGKLTAAHDAATAHLGAPWRMPTTTELSLLANWCDFTLTTRNGVDGVLVTGRGDYSSKSIFLPLAGYGYKHDICDFGTYNYDWSSMPSSAKSDHAYNLSFYSEFRLRTDSRYLGQSVRPVR